MNSETIYQSVNDRYSATALGVQSSKYSQRVAESFGYSAEELQSTPHEANLGLGCGNPLALASLKEGETVVDLGCGAGFDVLLAAKKVGQSGKVIGVDMNEDMLSKARTNAQKTNATNVSFLSSRITALPIPSSSVDVIISNCVINLVPHEEKHLVFKEAHRALTSGGRFAISDILIKQDLGEEMKSNMALYVGCVAGASKKEEYENWLKEAGFCDIVIMDTGADLNVYTQTEEGEGESGGCCGSKSDGTACGQSKKDDGGVVAGMKGAALDMDLNQWAGSFRVFAVKS